MSDKHVARYYIYISEYFGLAWRKEATGKLGVKPKLAFLTGLGDRGSLSSPVKWAIPAIRPWAFLNLFPVCWLQAVPADELQRRYWF